MSKTEVGKRVYSLDVLKCIAIAIIFMHHYQQDASVMFDSFNFFMGKFYWGNLVELFFFLSGYFTYKSLTRIASLRGAVTFVARKWLRFLPLLLLCGVCFLVVNQPFCAQFEGYNAFGWRMIATSLIGVSRWFTEAMMVNNPVWYISVLLLCYIVFALVAWLLQKANASKRTALVWIFIIAALGFVVEWVTKDHTIAYPFVNNCVARGIANFFWGMLLYPLLQKAAFQKGHVAGVVSLIGVGAFVVTYSMYTQMYLDHAEPYYLLYSLVVVPMVVIVFLSPVVSRLFSSSKFSVVGACSYSVYMWHDILIMAWVLVLSACGLAFDTRLSMVLCLVLCFAFGLLSTKIIEPVLQRPFDWLLAKLQD